MKWYYEPTCAELLGDGVNQVLGFFEAEDDVVTMGETAVTLFPLAVMRKAHF